MKSFPLLSPPYPVSLPGADKELACEPVGTLDTIIPAPGGTITQGGANAEESSVRGGQSK